jgi:hypothetical protein
MPKGEPAIVVTLRLPWARVDWQGHDGSPVLSNQPTVLSQIGSRWTPWELTPPHRRWRRSRRIKGCLRLKNMALPGSR